MLPPTADQISSTKRQIAALVKAISRGTKVNVADKWQAVFKLCVLLVTNNVALPSPKEISDLVYESFLKDNPSGLQVGEDCKEARVVYVSLLANIPEDNKYIENFLKNSTYPVIVNENKLNVELAAKIDRMRKNDKLKSVHKTINEIYKSFPNADLAFLNTIAQKALDDPDNASALAQHNEALTKHLKTCRTQDKIEQIKTSFPSVKDSAFLKKISDDLASLGTTQTQIDENYQLLQSYLKIIFKINEFKKYYPNIEVDYLNKIMSSVDSSSHTEEELDRYYKRVLEIIVNPGIENVVNKKNTIPECEAIRSTISNKIELFKILYPTENIENLENVQRLCNKPGVQVEQLIEYYKQVSYYSTVIYQIKDIRTNYEDKLSNTILEAAANEAKKSNSASEIGEIVLRLNTYSLNLKNNIQDVTHRVSQTTKENKNVYLPNLTVTQDLINQLSAKLPEQYQKILNKFKKEAQNADSDEDLAYLNNEISYYLKILNFLSTQIDECKRQNPGVKEDLLEQMPAAIIAYYLNPFDQRYATLTQELLNDYLGDANILRNTLWSLTILAGIGLIVLGILGGPLGIFGALAILKEALIVYSAVQVSALGSEVYYHNTEQSLIAPFYTAMNIKEDKKVTPEPDVHQEPSQGHTKT